MHIPSVILRWSQSSCPHAKPCCPIIFPEESHNISSALFAVYQFRSFTVSIADMSEYSLTQWWLKLIVRAQTVSVISIQSWIPSLGQMLHTNHWEDMQDWSLFLEDIESFTCPKRKPSLRCWPHFCPVGWIHQTFDVVWHTTLQVKDQASNILFSRCCLVSISPYQYLQHRWVINSCMDAYSQCWKLCHCHPLIEAQKLEPVIGWNHQ